MVSIIIPFKDKVELLQKCVGSVLRSVSSQGCEVILVNNESRKKKTLAYLKSLENNSKIIILEYAKPFNFSAINNFAVQKSAGDFLLFLNNDTESISSNWIEEMLKQFENPEVGAVGAKLLYPDGTIQHAGVKVGENIATHQFLGMNEMDLKENDIVREVDAVTGACMMTRRDLFLKVGGFDEKNLPIAYNDIDYCLKLRERGFKILWTPEAKLFHYESASRKSDMNVFAILFNRKRYKQFQGEQEYMRKRWKISSEYPIN